MFIIFTIINKIKDAKLLNSIHNIIENSKDFHATPFLYSFTDHGISHSDRMLKSINELLDGCQKRNLLNKYECYVLVAAIYLHDIGIQESKVDILELFAEKNKLSFEKSIDNIPEFVRTNHHLISSFLIREDIIKKNAPLIYDGDPELGEYISLVIESHGIDFSKKTNIYKTYIYHDKTIRVDLLSVLLCLADSFDCDNRRIDPKKFRYTELPKLSRIHWIKHLYVKGINFNNRIITISYIFPDLGVAEQDIYRLFFCNETEYWINIIKEKYLSILNRVDLVFELKREINKGSYLEKLDETDYAFIEEKVFENIINSEEIYKYKKVAIGILKYEDKLLMVQRKKPEQVFTENNVEHILEWQFPAGVIKTIDTPENAVVREVLEETGIKCNIKSIIGKRLHPDTMTLCYYFSLIYEDGQLINGDTNENATVAWVPVHEYRSRITSDIYWKVQKYLMKGVNDEI